MADNNARMTELVLGLPGQLLEGRRLGLAVRPKRRRVTGVMVAGMGGSGIGGRLAAGLLLDRSAVQFGVCQDYTVPACAGRETLFVAVSHSGNTEETLAAFAAARRRGCVLAAITGGGELQRAARAVCPVVTVPLGMPPRAALGYLFGALIGVLERFGVGAGVGAGLDEAVTLMLCRGPEWQQQARILARVLKGRLPVVYSTARLLDAVAVRWQAQLNENAKVLCHTHVLPEQNHNEIVGLGRPGRLGASAVVLALTDSSTHARTRQRLGQMLDICRTGIRAAVVIEAEGRAALARLLSLVMLGDLVSVELARVLGEDAMAIARIDELKKRMASS